jgi:hypothetical protein
VFNKVGECVQQASKLSAGDVVRKYGLLGGLQYMMDKGKMPQWEKDLVNVGVWIGLIVVTWKMLKGFFKTTGWWGVFSLIGLEVGLSYFS